jgi:hypothetical protein
MDRTGMSCPLLQRLTIGLARRTNILRRDRLEGHQFHTVDFDLAGATSIAPPRSHSWCLPEPNRERDLTGQDPRSKLLAELHGSRVFVCSWSYDSAHGASMIGRYSRQGPTASVYCFAIVFHDLSEVVEVMDDPCREELAKCHCPKVGMHGGAIQVLRSDSRIQLNQIRRPNLLESIQHRRDLPTTESFEPCFPVNGLEDASRAMVEDQPSAVHPVALLDVKEVPHDLVGRPRVESFVTCGPVFGQPEQHRLQHSGSAEQHLFARREAELHSSSTHCSARQPRRAADVQVHSIVRGSDRKTSEKVS